MRRRYLIFVLTALIATGLAAAAQNEELRLEVGIAGGGAFGLNESEDDQIQPYGRLFLSSNWIRSIQTECGAGYALNSDGDYETELIPIDLRMKVSPISSETIIPYLYAGFGALYYNVKTAPPDASQSDKLDGWTAHIPYGAGLQYRASDYIAIELSGGHNYTFTDEINPANGDEDDSFLCALLGLRYSLGVGSADPDGDGLINKMEKQLGTQRKNPDTDGDGLMDGEEFTTYLTNPLNSDSDGDGFGDGDEVKMYKTDPNQADTDGDGLSDRDEIVTYKTDPLEVDSDGDGLSDNEEVLTYETDPNLVDSDEDGLSDAQEITDYGTDPLKMDTDGGSIDDFAEVERGTDPLNPDDDFAEEEMIIIEEETPIVLEGVVFASGKAEVRPESEEILTKALNTLKAYPDIEIMIEGYTDNTGSRSFNMRLSQKRAEAVMQWLIDRGIAPERLSAEGLGPDNPIAPNDTEEGRAQNRRIEFARVK